MSAELAHQKADKHLCVALHRKLRIRLHPFAEFVRKGKRLPCCSNQW